MLDKYFDGYGVLSWIEPYNFWDGNWSVYEPHITASDGEDYSIVINGDGTEFRYTVI